MSQHLLDELARYQEHEEYAQKLRHLIEEDDELEIIMHQSTLTALQAIEYAITIRIHDISAQIEAPVKRLYQAHQRALREAGKQ